MNQTHKSREILVALHKDGDTAVLVSNQETLQLNSTSENPTERRHVLEFTLTPEAANDSFAILKVFDVEDSLNLSKKFASPTEPLFPPISNDTERQNHCRI